MKRADLPRIVIFGGTGFLGINLAQFLVSSGYAVTIIARHAPSQSGGWSFVPWDANELGPWVEEIDAAAAIINLAGRTVACIKTPENVDVILRSRVESTRLIGRAIRQVERVPDLWIQMSTAHIYGDPPTQMCSEESSFGHGLAPFVGEAWENAHQEALLPGMRSVVLRTSFVIGLSGGALPTLARLVRMRLGGTVGSGRQGMSWLHEEDMNRIFLRAIVDESMLGAYIASAPNPVSNAEFMRSLRRALRISLGLPAKAWMVRLGAPLVFKTDPDLALYGRYCLPKRLEELGFVFNYPNLKQALASLFEVTGKS